MLSTILLTASRYSDPFDGLFAGGFSLFFLCFYCGFIILGLVGAVLWIWMLIDLVQRDDNDFGSDASNSKVLWLLIILLTGWIGAVIYYFMIYKKYPRRK